MPKGDKAGRKTLYRPEYCEKLTEHMRKGKSFATFGPTVGVCWRVAYDWAETFAEFGEAKDMGDALRLAYLEDMGIAIATASLRRVSEEKVVRDRNGDVVFDQHGNPVTEKKYAPVRGDAKAWSDIMRAHGRKFGYANTVELTGRGGGPIRTRDVGDLTDDELEKELETLERKGL